MKKPYQIESQQAVKRLGRMAAEGNPAMQLVLLVHDTEFSCAPPPGSRGDGLGTIVQVLPFQVSARVKFW